MKIRHMPHSVWHVARGIRKWTGSTLGLQTTLHRIVFPPSAGLSLQLNLGGMSKYVQGGEFNRGLFFAGPPPSPLGPVSGKIREIR
jgi:hypothetical protein